MEVLCPKHRVPLKIEEIDLDIHHESYRSVVGKCPECKTVYINYPIFSSSKNIQINGVGYRYLQDLYTLFPFDPNAEKRKRAQEAFKTGAKEHAEIISAEEKARLERLDRIEKRREELWQKQLQAKEAFLAQKKRKQEAMNADAEQFAGDVKSLSKKEEEQRTEKTEVLQQGKARKDDEKKRVEQKKGEAIIYAMPVLYNSKEINCPICGGKLSRKKQTVKVVVFKERKPVSAGDCKSFYCKKCKLPYITREQAHSIALKLAPKRINTFEAEHCITLRGMQELISIPPEVLAQMRQNARIEDESTIKGKISAEELLVGKEIPYNTGQLPQAFDGKALFYTIALLKDSKNCPFCKRQLAQNRKTRVAVYKGAKVYSQVLIRIARCNKCKSPFITAEEKREVLKKIAPRTIYTFNALECKTPRELHERSKKNVFDSRDLPIGGIAKLLPFKTELSKNELPLLSEGRSSRIWVYANRCHCEACAKKYEQETICNRTARVKTLSGQIVSVGVQFCLGCGRYFMNITTFRQYSKKYGGLLLERELSPELVHQDMSWLNFAPDTILSRCGYSVKRGIPQVHRQTILAYILDSGKATKYEVLEILSRFVRLRKTFQPDACKRWEEDSLFVSNYKLKNQPIIEGLSFKKAGRYSE